MTPDPSREIEQVIEEMRERADTLRTTSAAYYEQVQKRIITDKTEQHIALAHGTHAEHEAGQIEKWLALLTAASPVSPDVRTEAQLDAAFACHSDRGLDGCADCGRPLNDGEAKCFTVCDACWVNYIKDLQDKQGGVIR